MDEILNIFLKKNRAAVSTPIIIFGLEHQVLQYLLPMHEAAALLPTAVSTHEVVNEMPTDF